MQPISHSMLKLLVKLGLPSLVITQGGKSKGTTYIHWKICSVTCSANRNFDLAVEKLKFETWDPEGSSIYMKFYFIHIYTTYDPYKEKINTRNDICVHLNDWLLVLEMQLQWLKRKTAALMTCCNTSDQQMATTDYTTTVGSLS